MDLPPHTAYSDVVKSLVLTVEKFIVNIDENDITIADESVILSFRKMGRTLQRIFSKWDKRKPSSKEQLKTNIASRLEICGDSKSPSTGGLIDERFLYNKCQDESLSDSVIINIGKNTNMIERKCSNRVENFIDILNQKMKQDIEDSSDEDVKEDAMSICETKSNNQVDENFEMLNMKGKQDIENSVEQKKYDTVSICDMFVTSPKKCKRDEVTKMDISSNSIFEPLTIDASKKSKLDKVTETDIFSNTVLEQLTSTTYKCKVCDIDLPKNNVASHLNGKNHKNKQAQEKNNSNHDDDLNSLSGMKTELIEDKNGDRYITIRLSSVGSYFCKLCKVEISKYDHNLIQHVTGQQHKRLCTCRDS